MVVKTITTLPQRGPFEVNGRDLLKHTLTSLTIAFVALALCLAAARWWVYSTFTETRRVARVWSEGLPGQAVRLDGDVCTSRFIFKHYVLRVAFRSAEGFPHTITADFRVSGFDYEEGEVPEVRYLPEDPTNAVTSWQQEVQADNWLRLIAESMITLVLLAVAIFAFYFARRYIDKIRALASQGVLVEATTGTVCR